DLDGQLQRVDRVEAEAVGEERLVDVDLLRLDILQHERLHDHALQVVFDVAHDLKFAVRVSAIVRPRCRRKISSHASVIAPAFPPKAAGFMGGRRVTVRTALWEGTSYHGVPFPSA